MVIIGSRMAVAAYATSTTLRIVTPFSPSLSFPSQVFRPSPCWSQASINVNAAPFRPTLPSKLSMAAASTSADLADSELDIASNILSVKQRISDAISSNDRPEGSVRLVAVSKTKPLEFLQVAYQAGQRCFGENYAQELISKSKDMPDDVRWHFIGPLQTNKATRLVTEVGLAKLACIETVGTLKLAAKLNRTVESLNEGSDDKKILGVYIQVNTSGEESKSGVTPGGELADLVQQISVECKWLSIDGLMTIGAPGDDSCFDLLRQCRDEVAIALNRDPNDLELSMGMSGDFEVAIAKGATSVRVGSTIFGERDYSTTNNG